MDKRSNMIEKYYNEAIKGDKIAQFVLGMAYEKGTYCEIDIEQACYWLQKAADQGHELAMIELIILLEYYDEYILLTKDALYYLHDAVKGSAEAMADLGACYYMGESGAPQSYELAVKWFKTSVEYHSAVGAYLLALCYKEGNGVPQSLSKTCHYYLIAAELGDTWSMYMYAICCLNGLGHNYSIEEGILWAKKASDKGLMEAKELLEDYGYYE